MIDILFYILVPLYVLVCLILIVAILLQPGKGGGLGAALGSGTSQQIFGGRGSTPFLEKLTMGLAIAFAILTVSLSIVIHERREPAILAKKRDEEKTQKDLEEKRQKELEESKKKALEQDEKQKKQQAGSNLMSVPPSGTPGKTDVLTNPPVDTKPTPVDGKTTPTDVKKIPADQKTTSVDIKSGVGDTKPGVVDTKPGVGDTKPGIVDTKKEIPVPTGSPTLDPSKAPEKMDPSTEKPKTSAAEKTTTEATETSGSPTDQPDPSTPATIVEKPVNP